MKIRVRTYLPSDTTVPHESPVPEIIVKKVNITVTSISIKAGFGNPFLPPAGEIQDAVNYGNLRNAVMPSFGALM